MLNVSVLDSSENIQKIGVSLPCLDALNTGVTVTVTTVERLAHWNQVVRLCWGFVHLPSPGACNSSEN